ncbi:uncharacterized protein B0H18DRAFT_1051890 [Fomitopsis serialis]|uniref:uncharacterized protein n=1 Tax=Fomitopsis serialis TaxID=139415 RepID=UPI0020088961|nr:uncharacterized protein B0H18DRAFT_1051890 [Neoantrodia serialis]KAH9912799.1 hypothetical protein B0H18DRAFT_1051890 [Neoantrodia serialis]
MPMWRRLVISPLSSSLSARCCVLRAVFEPSCVDHALPPSDRVWLRADMFSQVARCMSLHGALVQTHISACLSS